MDDKGNVIPSRSMQDQGWVLSQDRHVSPTMRLCNIVQARYSSQGAKQVDKQGTIDRKISWINQNKLETFHYFATWLPHAITLRRSLQCGELRLSILWRLKEFRPTSLNHPQVTWIQYTIWQPFLQRRLCTSYNVFLFFCRSVEKSG